MEDDCTPLFFHLLTTNPLAEEKSRLERLTAITTQLQSKRMVTARELANRHQVSIRTIYRDIRSLEKSGIPISTDEGKGYRLVDGFRLPPVMFTQEEANALVTAEQIILKNSDHSLVENYEKALLKIKSVLKHSQKEKTELLESRLQIRSNIREEATSSDLLIQLQAALTNFQVVEIEYTSLESKTTVRKIEPFAIFSTGGNWLMVAFCLLRNEFRSFRLDQIQLMKPTNTFFEPHKMTLEQYFEKCREGRDTPDTQLTQTP